MEKKPSPEDILDAIEDAPIDDAAEQVLAMTPEQRRRELERAGVSERDVDAGVDAVLARMQRGGGGSDAGIGAGNVVPMRPPRRAARTIGIIAAAAVAAAVGLVLVTEGAAIVAWLRGPEKIGPDNVHPPPAPRPELAQHELAEQLRDEAEAAFGAGFYAECLRKLDAAKQIDAAGDEEPRVQNLRAEVRERTQRPLRPEKP